MSLVRFAGRNHPQQVGARGPNPSVDDRATAWEVFEPLMDRFRFTIDVAASAVNTKCKRFYSIDDDGLAQPWLRERVWCNPPYSDIRPWVEKAWAEFNEENGATCIVMLLPANRTEQAWWQDLVEDQRDSLLYPLRVEFLRGRIRFIHPGKSEIGPNERPPFGSCLLIWER